jgi:Xaa-Pro aminopeptidase
VNADRHLERMVRAASAAGDQGFAGLVIAPSPDLVYLSGYDPMPLERPTLLVIRPDAEPVMLVPDLELPPAREAPVGASIELIGWSDGDDPYEAAARLLPVDGRLGVGDRLWASHVLALQAVLPGCSFTTASAVLGHLRAVKDAEELTALRAAARAADSAFEGIRERPFVGRTEAQVASDLARLLVDAGHDRADFTIVAGGPNAASPHHEAGGRTIRPGDPVVMDFGGALDGYFSDMTRTVVAGEPPPGFEEVYGVVRDAQQQGVAAARPGVAAGDVDGVAREVIRRAGYGEWFVHRTGHGIGLEVHEPPYLVRGNDQQLEPGMAFSVEPGVYLPGRFGVRIEDIVSVTSEGAESLNRSPRDLLVVT